SPESFAITATEGIENPELPERPAEMDNYDEDGAMAAAEYFLRLSLYGIATDNWEDYTALCQATCGFCNSYRDKNHEDWKNISSSTMPEMKVLSAFSWQKEDTPKQWRVDALVERYPSTFVDKEKKVHRDEGGTAALAFLLDSSNGWRVVEVESFDIEEYEKMYGENE
ncbi:MAG: hypothetical protein IKZ87_03795, partial [Actinomycetaceae bacterium]|nr:hypothetical protein [Actinomycetaceae bacterium]